MAYPFDKEFKKIFHDRAGLHANLIVLRMPFHRTGSMHLMDAAVSMSRYMALMATTVVLLERLIGALEDPRVMVAGFSLGAFVANRHHLHYGTAAVYVPFVAGTMQGDIFPSLYPGVTNIRENQAEIRQKLNFDAQWACCSHENVFPVLTRHDCVNLVEVQGPSYGDMQVEIWDLGHLSVWSAHRMFREKMLRHFEHVVGSESLVST